MSRKLDPQAAQKADDAFYEKHPEMIQDGKRTPIDPKNKADVKEWNSLYSQESKKSSAKKSGAGSSPTISKKSAAPKKIGKSVADCPCSISKFEVKCSHGRKSGSENILQIVATPVQARSNTVSLVGMITVSNQIELKGSDSVDASLVCKGTNCRNEIQFRGGDVPNQNWKAGKKRSEALEIEAYETSNAKFLPLGKVNPVEYKVEGRNQTDQKTITVQQFPNDYYSFQVQVDTLAKVAEEINDNWEKWGKKFFSWSPVSLAPTLTLPAGSLKGSHGWKEEKESWRAYYELSCEAGLDPFLGIEIKVVLSLLKVAAGLVGVPPIVADLASEYLADICVATGIGCTTKCVGSATNHNYYPQGNKWSGAIHFTAEGYFLIEMWAQIGNKNFVSVKATGGVKVSIEGDGALLLEREGVFFQPEIKLKPATIKVEVVATAFIIFEKKKDKSWKLWKEDIDIWTGGKSMLLDFRSGS